MFLSYFWNKQYDEPNVLLRSSWGKDLNRYLYFSYRKVFGGIRQGVYSLGIDFDIDKKENFVLSDLNKDAKPEPADFNLDSNIQAEPVYFKLDGNVQKESVKAELDENANAEPVYYVSDSDIKIEPVYFELDRNILEESVKVELDKDAKIETVDLELDVNIQAEQVNYEIDRVTMIDPVGFELNSDVKSKSVDLLPKSQIFSAGNDSNLAVESPPQISVANINVLATSFKGQSETDTQFSKSSLIPVVDSFSQKFSAKRLFAPLLGLIDEPGGVNSGSFQDVFPFSGYFESLIENISTFSDFSLSKIQPLENLAGVFDQPDHLLAWNTLALDFATASTSGPTPVTRWISYINRGLWDAWAVFEDKAVGSIHNQDKQDNFIALLESFEISCNNLAEFEYLYQASTSIVKEILIHAVREVAMDVSAFNVFSEIQSSLFIGGMPGDLVGTAKELLAENLASTAELLSVKKIADLVISIGTNIGETVSSSIKQYALSDNSNQLGFYEDTTGYFPPVSVYEPDNPNSQIDSFWIPQDGQIPLTPQWREVTTFAIDTNDMIPAEIVTPYTDQGDLDLEFIRQLIEVRDIGISLTALEKAIAELYEGGDGTAFPPGYWHDIAIDLAVSRNLNLDESLKVLYGVAQSMFDAGIATWATKYQYQSVRPGTYVPQYEPDTVLSDGTLASEWKPYLETPSFPDTPSGHSAFSSAANYFLIDYFGSNYFDFTVILKDDDSIYSVNGFDGMPGSGDDIVISATFFSEASAQAGISRLYGGIHAADGDLRGQLIGNKTGLKVSQKIDSLEQGLSLEEVSSLQSQSFGTMGDNILTGLSSEAFDANSVQQVYGFSGDDTLMAKGESLWELYGGFGMDTFQIYETGLVSVRDYESMEKIELAETILQPGESIDDIQFLISATEPFTDVSLNDRLLLTLDGYWNSENVNLLMLA